MARKKSEKTDVITSIKGFDSNLRCRGYQFEIGKTYSVEGKIKACENGFHACPVDEHPLSVFEFYPPAGSKYGEVEQSGDKDREGTKLASASLTVKIEIHLHELIARTIKYVFDRAKPEEGSSATGDYGAASATGNRGAASATGDYGAASATGDRGAASATGYYGAASATGDQGAASATGDQGAASATGDRGAASATGDYGAASATGNRGAASATGNYGAASATGNYGAAMASGYEGSVSGAKGNPLFLVERNEKHEAINVWAGIAGKDGIKENTFYTLKGGKPVEVE